MLHRNFVVHILGHVVFQRFQKIWVPEPNRAPFRTFLARFRVPAHFCFVLYYNFFIWPMCLETLQPLGKFFFRPPRGWSVNPLLRFMDGYWCSETRFLEFFLNIFRSTHGPWPSSHFTKISVSNSLWAVRNCLFGIDFWGFWPSNPFIL